MICSIDQQEGEKHHAKIPEVTRSTIERADCLNISSNH